VGIPKCLRQHSVLDVRLANAPANRQGGRHRPDETNRLNPAGHLWSDEAAATHLNGQNGTTDLKVEWWPRPE
jgi:hypothetical protein